MRFDVPTLVVAAHADDESLGCGGTIAKIVASGGSVTVLFLADGESSRFIGNEETELLEVRIKRRKEMASSALSHLGVNKSTFLDLKDNRLDTVPLLELTKMIENAIDHYAPEMIITHHPYDLNIDHKMAAIATITATRPFQDQIVRQLIAFETPSSSEWNVQSQVNVFAPNFFVDISEVWGKKVSALKAYSEEMRDFPHPRSIESIEALARWRGSNCGREYAEAFTLLRSVQ